MMKELYQQANAYRLHQDTLRWNLFAGYIAFMAAIAGFLDKLKLLPSTWAIALVIMANLLLLVFAVESFYYNLFTEYVAFCERILLGRDPHEKPLTAREYASQHAKRISPTHPSYSVAMLVVVFGNAGLVELLCPTHRWLHVLGPVLFLIVRFWWQLIGWPIVRVLLVKSK
jgi:hypothetical protein